MAEGKIEKQRRGWERLNPSKKKRKGSQRKEEKQRLYHQLQPSLKGSSTASHLLRFPSWFSAKVQVNSFVFLLTCLICFFDLSCLDGCFLGWVSRRFSLFLGPCFDPPTINFHCCVLVMCLCGFYIVRWTLGWLGFRGSSVGFSYGGDIRWICFWLICEAAEIFQLCLFLFWFFLVPKPKGFMLKSEKGIW